MTLARLANERLTGYIKVGTSVGKGFIYQGTWSGFLKWIRSAEPADYPPAARRRANSDGIIRAARSAFPFREVVDHYYSTVTSDTLIVIIDGQERGTDISA